MQTFLPYSDFRKSFQVLDYKRLGKQRVEAKQILNALEKRAQGITSGWTNHPATVMWEGYEEALQLYHDLCIDEWVSRGYNNNMPKFDASVYPTMPKWLGNENFHSSHKSNLLRKDPVFYGKYNWVEPDNLEYIWPVKEYYVE